MPFPAGTEVKWCAVPDYTVVGYTYFEGYVYYQIMATHNGEPIGNPIEAHFSEVKNMQGATCPR